MGFGNPFRRDLSTNGCDGGELPHTLPSTHYSANHFLDDPQVADSIWQSKAALQIDHDAAESLHDTAAVALHHVSLRQESQGSHRWPL